ncbi:MAG TPA: STAS domain-containing protein, partial [Candidatus Sulfopaludibacter sp.]|nr:STAS domain-containing protein [Candidatus Sulfopaludibacter sp.]
MWSRDGPRYAGGIMLLQIEEKRVEPDIALVELKGRLALGRESQRVEALAGELVKSGRLKAILDLTGVDYIDSAGLGILALVAGKLKEAGGRLAVVAPEGRVLSMLNMTQMTQILSVSPSVGEAM